MNLKIMNDFYVNRLGIDPVSEEEGRYVGYYSYMSPSENTNRLCKSLFRNI